MILLNGYEGTTPIPKADIEAKMNEIGTESNYAQQRKSAYPEIGDQLDMLWHSIDQDAELKQKYFDFYQAIKSVKVKYPKMANIYKNAGFALSTTNLTTIYTVPSNRTAIVKKVYKLIMMMRLQYKQKYL